MLVSSTLSLTALHSLAPGLIYAPNFTARIKAMRTPLIGSACPLSDEVHQAPLLAPLTDVKMSLQTKVAQLRRTRKLPFCPLPSDPLLPWLDENR